MSFRHLFGHRATLSILSRAIDAGSLPPSLIFAGQDGVGKRSAALAVAQALNCPAPLRPARGPDGSGPLPIDGCGECPTCRRIARGVHPDVIVVEPGDNGSIRIEAVREEVRKTGFKPFEAKRRVILFDHAEALTTDAQDALLKTLEEPPPSSVLILVTSQPHLLLPTVRSRCPGVRFAPLAAADVAAWLMREQQLSEPQARAVAAVARGSLTVARETADTGVENVRAAAQRVLEHVADAADPRQRLEAAKELVGKGRGAGASERDSLATHLHALGSLLRDLGALSTEATSGVMNPDLEPALARLSPAFDTDRTLRAFEAVDRALGALDRNASAKTVADWVVLQL